MGRGARNPGCGCCGDCDVVDKDWRDSAINSPVDQFTTKGTITYDPGVALRFGTSSNAIGNEGLPDYRYGAVGHAIGYHDPSVGSGYNSGDELLIYGDHADNNNWTAAKITIRDEVSQVDLQENVAGTITTLETVNSIPQVGWCGWLTSSDWLYYYEAESVGSPLDFTNETHAGVNTRRQQFIQRNSAASGQRAGVGVETWTTATGTQQLQHFRAGSIRDGANHCVPINCRYSAPFWYGPYAVQSITLDTSGNASNWRWYAGTGGMQLNDTGSVLGANRHPLSSKVGGYACTFEVPTGLTPHDGFTLICSAEDHGTYVGIQARRNVAKSSTTWTVSCVISIGGGVFVDGSATTATISGTVTSVTLFGLVDADGTINGKIRVNATGGVQEATASSAAGRADLVSVSNYLTGLSVDSLNGSSEMRTIGYENHYHADLLPSSLDSQFQLTKKWNGVTLEDETCPSDVDDLPVPGT